MMRRAGHADLLSRCHGRRWRPGITRGEWSPSVSSMAVLGVAHPRADPSALGRTGRFGRPPAPRSAPRRSLRPGRGLWPTVGGNSCVSPRLGGDDRTRRGRDAEGCGAVAGGFGGREDAGGGERPRTMATADDGLPSTTFDLRISHPRLSVRRQSVPSRCGPSRCAGAEISDPSPAKPFRRLRGELSTPFSPFLGGGGRDVVLVTVGEESVLSVARPCRPRGLMLGTARLGGRATLAPAPRRARSSMVRAGRS